MEALKNKKVLIIEDSPEDFMAMQRTFKKMNFQSPVYRCQDGYEAINFLTGQGEYHDTPPEKPNLILLDLNLPGINGNTVLRKIKATKDFNSIPVIIFTTSTNHSDINDCYDNGGNCYIVKPIEYTEFESVLKNVINFWLVNVQLPVKNE